MPRPSRFDYIRPVTMERPPARPPAPKGLSAGAAKHWRDIVAAKPADYFDAANQLLLGCLCEHIAHSDWIAQRISGLDPCVPKDFLRLRALLMMAHRQTAAIASLMTKLRLLPGHKPPPRRPGFGYVDGDGKTRPWEKHV